MVTFNSLRQRLENLQRTTNDPRPPISQSLRYSLGCHLHQSTQSYNRKFLIMYPREARLIRIDSHEPSIKEHACHAGCVSFHEVKCSGGVVEDTVYEHVQVCETEGRSFGLVEEGESGDNDGLEVL